MPRRVPRLLLAAIAIVAATPAPRLPPAGIAVATPADIYGPLYRAVEQARLLPDSKSFADAVPRRDPGAIVSDYRRRPPADRAALAAFVAANFTLPTVPLPPRPPAGAIAVPLARHIGSLWPVLTRPAAEVPAGGSALPLPSPYVVPGGRFRELYYWDSYFTMLGLAAQGRDDLVEAMIDDFASLIERYGHIPNGTRSYYLSRSQPPAFFLMLGLSCSRDAAVFRRRLAALRAEHDYWMLGEDQVAAGGALLHVVRTPDGSLLNRYWDARDTPRDESYAEDVATARTAGRPVREVWRELRAGAESGWDYSSRWLGGGRILGDIRVTTIAPVDLNSLLYGQELAIAAGCLRLADTACVREYGRRAERRGAAIRRLMWRPRERAFADVEWRSGRPTPGLTAASLFPLFAGVATPAQAAATAETVRRRLLAPGGLRTTAIRTGQQWDAPNGWAPLQWIAIAGLRRSGEDALARTIASRWLATVAADYRARGVLVEKYDVERRGRGGGGEYPNQQGFGWTNGVAARLIADYGAP
ncbi:alpha,alpha-trehalase TreF [Sphingomonas sp.]|uniref:alpha,alpha-trehalase TreF n=1 Tax=Sphingomonas sp. TaxID=28214 RepID=UPI003AFFCD21